LVVLRIDRLSLDYQAFYCEENVWRLLAREELGDRRTWAVIVSSLSGHFVALRQKAGRHADGLVCWDYHVLAVVDDSDGTRLALDLDSDLPFPSSLGHYLDESFPRRLSVPQQPQFRLVESAEYLASLVSDRSHMRSPDGNYTAPPPPWPAPGGNGPSTFMSWIDPSSNSPGTVYDLATMRGFARGSGATPETT
jgi:protein N-terminal glutamine amidohydrolase